jgi:hypothetical protein
MVTIGRAFEKEVNVRALMIAFALILSMLPFPAAAALFCVQVTGIPQECSYDDAASCRARARQLGGVCGVNPQEMPLPVGYGSFCLVTSERVTQCVYSDRNSCEAEAQRNHASVCVDNKPAGTLPEPYKYIPQKAY